MLAAYAAVGIAPVEIIVAVDLGGGYLKKIRAGRIGYVLGYSLGVAGCRVINDKYLARGRCGSIGGCA